MNPSIMAELVIICCEISYAALPNYYKYILGVTGTLQILPTCQKKVLNEWYDIEDRRMFYIPSVYGDSRR